MHRLLKLGVVLGLLASFLVLSGVAAAAPGDDDNDTIADGTDNCPSLYNIDQNDFDEDGVGNTCDATPGVGADASFTILYHRNVSTGGPLSADPTGPRCATVSRVLYENGVLIGETGPFCHRQFTNFLTPVTRSYVLTLLADPPGCRALYTTPMTFGYTGSDLFTAVNAYYLCDEALLLENLLTGSTGVGPGSSLADKVASAQASYASGDLAAACSTLAAYINQVRAQSGKKLSAATAASLTAQAEAIRTDIGC